MEKVVLGARVVLLVGIGIGGLSTACGADEATMSDADTVKSRSSEMLTSRCAANGGASGGSGAGPVGQLITFVNGAQVNGAVYTGASDATIEAALPTTNQGAAEDCTADGATQERACLLRWDLSGALPKSTIVTRAWLKLTVSDVSRASYGAFQVQPAWSEGGVTWTRPQATGSNWATPGAKGASDRGLLVVADISPRTIGQYTIPIDASTVQSWVSHPTTNAGIIFARDDAVDGVSFVSSNTADMASRPTLEVCH